MFKISGLAAVRTKKKPLKLVVVGGGSFFVPSFVGSMVMKPGIWAGAEVCLNDPDSERVRLVKMFNEKYVARQNFPMTFTAQPDLNRALEGADFVITTVRIGGVRALHLDENIPPRFGYLGDETAGPGGMFMAIRTVPVAVALAKRMEKICPDAWLLNYSNPTHYITAGVLQTTGIKSVGLCDNYIAAKNDFAFLLGLSDVKNIKVRFCGYNHCNWVYSANYRGRDLLKALKQSTLTERKKHLVKAKSERGKWLMERGLELLDLTGRFPVATGHSMPYFFHTEFLKRELKYGGPHKFIEEVNKKNWDTLKSQLIKYDEETANRVVRAQHGGAHADLAIGVASAIAADTGEEYPVNMRNGNTVPGFSKEEVTEFYAKISKKGCTPVKVPAFPPVLLAHQQLLNTCKNLVVQGILEKNKAKFLEALLLHPFTSSASKAKELFETMWREEETVHGAYWK